MSAGIVLRDYQESAVSEIRESYRAGNRSVVFVLSTGGGKCLGKGTPVVLADGRVIPVEEVQAGDKLLGPSGGQRNVLSVCRGSENLYRVTPNRCGEPFVCNESHILSLRVTGGSTVKGFPSGSTVNVSVRDYLLWAPEQKHVCKLWRSPAVEFDSGRRRLPIAPYILGLWLGDGSSRTASLTTADWQSVMAWRDEAQRLGLFVRDEPAGGVSRTYVMTSLIDSAKGHHGRGGSNAFMIALRSLGVLKNKHIPEMYRTASAQDRMQLLAGLVDSDGSVHRSGLDFVFKSETLARDLVFVARSLGLSAHIKSCEKTCTNNGKRGAYWRISVNGDCDAIPVRIDRKRPPARRQKKSHLVTGFRVEPIGCGDYYGFELDGDHLFLLGDFTVSHNTVCFSYIVAASQRLGKRCLVLVHRRELVEQASRTFDSFGIEHGLIMSGRSRNLLPVQIAMVGTVVRRLDKIAAPDFIVVDEAHHALAATYRKIIEAFPAAKVLGVTATPQRTDGAGLGDVFGSMVVGPSMRSLIEREALAPYSLFGPPAKVDLSGVKTVRGDYDQKQLAREMDRAVVTGDAVEHYQRIVGNGLALAFCVGREHAEHVAEAFRGAGIPAERIDGSMTVAEREAILARFESGETRVMTSADLISEGFDVPAVEAAILLRPTQSVILYLQQVGRALRPAPGKAKAYIIDHVGNFRLHGFPDDERGWSLEGRKKGEKRELGKIPVTTCQNCFAAYRPHLPECPHCGAERIREGRTLEYVDGQLLEITPHIERMRTEKAWLEAEKAAGRTPVMWPVLDGDVDTVPASIAKASVGGQKGVSLRICPVGLPSVGAMFRPYNSMPAQQLRAVGKAFGYKPFWAARTHFFNRHKREPERHELTRAMYEASAA